MCQQQFFRHAGCQHKKLHPTDPLVMCHRAPNRFFGHHCQNLKNTVLDDGPPFCKSCQLQLERRLEGVRRAQEKGLEWTPTSFNWGLKTSLSIDEEIERNQVADTGGA